MRHLAVALIAIALLGCDLAADLWIDDTETIREWDIAATVGLVCAFIHFTFWRDVREDGPKPRIVEVPQDTSHLDHEIEILQGRIENLKSRGQRTITDMIQSLGPAASGADELTPEQVRELIDKLRSLR